MSNGKGDARRPSQVSQETWEREYMRIFGGSQDDKGDSPKESPVFDGDRDDDGKCFVHCWEMLRVSNAGHFHTTCCHCDAVYSKCHDCGGTGTIWHANPPPYDREPCLSCDAGRQDASLAATREYNDWDG